mgnify:CR=1 FL=1
MKKFFSIAVIFSLPFSVNAQIETREVDTNIFNVCATIFVVALFMIFILTIIKRILDHRLKNKIVEKGVSEDVTASLLQTNPKEDRNINIKWFAILAGIGTGLTIIKYTLPLGIHSLAIIAFSIAASFLGYFFFLKQLER